MCDGSSDSKTVIEETKAVMKFEVRPGNPSAHCLRRAIQKFIAECLQDDDPKLLVATHVSPTWDPPNDIPKCKFLLNTQTGELFIIEVPSRPHARVKPQIAGDCVRWLRAHNLRDFLRARIGGDHNFGPLHVSPDITISPTSSWDGTENREPRLVVEVEYKHRCPKAAREHGFDILASNARVRAYLLIKVYEKDAGTGMFAATAILWDKGPAGPPAAMLPPPTPHPPTPRPGFPAAVMPLAALADQLAAAWPLAGGAGLVPVFHSAFSFGTEDVNINTRNAFNEVYLPTDPILPAALIPPPPPAAAPPAAWQFRIPAHDIVYLIRDDPGNLVSLPIPIVAGANDLFIDLDSIRRILAGC